jgi:Na+/proline symporter
MQAVAWTDLVQGIIMILGFAILAPVAVSAAGGFSEMHRQYGQLNPGAISFLGKTPVVWVVSSFLVWGFFQIGGSPAAVTRFLIPEDDKTLKRALVTHFSRASSTVRAGSHRRSVCCPLGSRT